MPLYTAKVAGTYKDISFAPGEVIDVAQEDVSALGFDDAEKAELHADAPQTPEAPAPEKAPETPATPAA